MFSIICFIINVTNILSSSSIELKNVVITSKPADSKTCEYERFDNVAKWEGNNAGPVAWVKTQEECEKICDSRRGCNSFSIEHYSSSTACWFKAKKLYGFEEQKVKNNVYSVYKVCQNEMMSTEGCSKVECKY